MANKSVREALYDEECNACWLKRSLKCSQCMNKYREPHCFPDCQHSFCREPCFANLLEGLAPGDLVQCPNCNNKYPVPEKGIDGFPQNHALKGLLDVTPQEIAKFTAIHHEKEHVKCRGFRPSMTKKLDNLRRKAHQKKHAERIELAKAGKLATENNESAEAEQNLGGNTEVAFTAENTKDLENQTCGCTHYHVVNKSFTDKSVDIRTKTETKSTQFTQNSCVAKTNASLTNTNTTTMDTVATMADTTTAKGKRRTRKAKTRCGMCNKMTYTQYCSHCNDRMCQKCMSEHGDTFLFEVIDKPDGSKELVPLEKSEDALSAINLKHAPGDTLPENPMLDKYTVQNKVSIEAIKRVLSPLEANVLDYVTRYVACEAQPFEIFLVASLRLRRNVLAYKKHAHEVMKRAADYSRDDQVQNLLRIQGECFKYLYVIDQIKGDTCVKPEEIRLDETVINSIVKKIKATVVKLRVCSDISQRQLKYMEKLKTFQLVTLYDPAIEPPSKLMKKLRGTKTPLDKSDLGESSSLLAELKMKKTPSFRYISGNCEMDAVWDNKGIDVVIRKGLGGTRENPFTISKHCDPIEDIYRRTLDNLARVPENNQIIRAEDFGVTFVTEDEQSSGSTTTQHIKLRFNITATGTTEQLKNLEEVIKRETDEMNKLDEVEVTRTEARIYSRPKVESKPTTADAEQATSARKVEESNVNGPSNGIVSLPPVLQSVMETVRENERILSQFDGIRADPVIFEKMKKATEERNREEEAASESNKYGKCRPKPRSEKPIIVENNGVHMMKYPLGHMENGRFIPSLDDFDPPSLSKAGEKSRWHDAIRPKDSSPESRKTSGAKSSPTREAESTNHSVQRGTAPEAIRPKNSPPGSRKSSGVKKSPTREEESTDWNTLFRVEINPESIADVSPSHVGGTIPSEATPTSTKAGKESPTLGAHPVVNGVASDNSFALNGDTMEADDSPEDDIMMADILRIIDEVD